MSESWFWLRSWSHDPWVRALHWALHWQCGACLGFCLPLSLSLPCLLSISLKTNENKLWKKSLSFCLNADSFFLLYSSIVLLEYVSVLTILGWFSQVHGVSYKYEGLSLLFQGIFWIILFLKCFFSYIALIFFPCICWLFFACLLCLSFFSYVFYSFLNFSFSVFFFLIFINLYSYCTFCGFWSFLQVYSSLLNFFSLLFRTVSELCQLLSYLLHVWPSFFFVVVIYLFI